jgi:hypothetical protein
MNYKIISRVAIVCVLVIGYYIFVKDFSFFESNIVDFESCVGAGNPVMESYPEQCSAGDGRTFTRDIGNELEKHNLIHIESPRPNEKITNPIVVTGIARGKWFFEGVFPLILTDWDGRIIAESYATARGEWMTEDFVPFVGVIEFEKPAYGERGTLIFKKDNPSGLVEHDDALEIPIFFD